LAIGRGDAAGARRDLVLAIASLPRVIASGGFAVLLAATHLEGSDLEPLHALLAQSLLPSDVPGRNYRALANAILEGRFGDRAGACRRASEAAAGYRQAGQPLLEAWALEIAGDLNAALSLYQRCGATAEVRRLRAPDAGVASASPLLSKREEDVAHRVARGATNAQIAEDLAISVRTVEKHIAAIFLKLGLRKRSQIAATFARRA